MQSGRKERFGSDQTKGNGRLAPTRSSVGEALGDASSSSQHGPLHFSLADGRKKWPAPHYDFS